jgi:hypothetical protein
MTADASDAAALTASRNELLADLTRGAPTQTPSPTSEASEKRSATSGVPTTRANAPHWSRCAWIVIGSSSSNTVILRSG